MKRSKPDPAADVYEPYIGLMIVLALGAALALILC
jgi:hypothetical protein